MARIREDESRELRLRAALHGFELTAGGTVRAKTRGVNRSHDYLERKKAKWARRPG